VVAVVFMAAAPAGAKLTQLNGRLTSTGGITVTWHGDRARGCAEAGLCGYRGSTFAQAAGDGQFALLLSKGRLRFGYASLFAPAPVVRVRRTEESGEGGGCADLAPERELELAVGRASTSSAVRIGFLETGLSAGRCAGPDVSTALSRLPKHTVALARLARPGSVVDLSGSAPFGSGRFSGTVRSTIKVHVGPPDTQPVGPDSRPAPHSPASGRLVRVVDVLVRYRVTGLRGKLSATFGGLAAPLCASVDGCGVAGTESWAILSAGGGTVWVEGEARVRPSEHGLRDALAAIRRRGHFFTQSSLRHALGATAATVVRPDGSACHDSRTVLAPVLATDYDDAALKVGLSGPGDYYSSDEILRTGCPGPVESDVLGRKAVASGQVPGAAIGRRRLAVTMTGAGRFRGVGYAGAHRSRFTISLRRESARATYDFVRLRR
jgi:hypothetical protein